MEIWVSIYAGHDKQVEQDLDQLSAEGVPARIVESSTEVLSNPYASDTSPAAELQVLAEHESRAREVLDLPEDYDDEVGVPYDTPRWKNVTASLLGLFALTWFMIVAIMSRGVVRFIGLLLCLFIVWVGFHSIRSLRPPQKDPDARTENTEA